MSVSRSEWTDWKANNVTRAFFHAADERIEEAKDILSGSAGQDSDADNFLRGFISAYREMKGFRVEDIDND